MVSTGSVFDRARLDLITNGDPDLARELIDLLIGEATPLLDGLAAKIAAQDGDSVRKDAHAVKGIAGNVGAIQLFEAARALELGATEGVGWDEIGRLLAGATTAFAAVRAERDAP